MTLDVRLLDVNMTAEATRAGTTNLLDLPNEVMFEVVQYIDLKRDLLSLSLTCRKLEDVAAKRLYQRVDIQIASAKPIYLYQDDEGMLFRQHVFQAMQELTMRSGGVNSTDSMQFKNKSPDHSVNDYVCGTLQKVPHNQLRAFALLYQVPLSTKMLRILATNQSQSLESLRCFEVDCDELNARPLSNLKRIQCRSIQSGEALASLVQASQYTLEVLHMGQEKELSRNYRRSRMGFHQQIAELPSCLKSILTFDQLPKLRQLRLVGLDLESSLPHDTQPDSFLWQLEVLTIESCAGTRQFLDALSAAFHYAQHPQNIQSRNIVPVLAEFTFRHEALSGHVKNALINFLHSFAGLRGLALLFENATLVERPSTFIGEHGRTLESLVIETRIQPREHLGLDTSRPLGIGDHIHQLWQRSINDICELCPNLVELGMGFPWDDEMIRLKKTKLFTLRKLRTVHIRNFPQSQVLSQIGDYAILEHARRFVEWSFPPLVGSDRPGLETLAIGPTLYESRWKCTSRPGSSSQSPENYRRCFDPPEYLRTHYFCLDWGKTRFGRWHAMATPVTERYVEETRVQSPLEGIFDHVWLR